MAPELQEDLLGTKVKKVLLVFTYIYNLSLHWCLRDVMAPELQEDWGGTKVISYCSLGLFLNSSVRDRKRCPSTSLYELRCV